MKLPKYLEERFSKLEAEGGLIDDCKYILYFNDGWGFYEGAGVEPGTTVPVRSQREAIYYLKNAVRKEDCM